jgi:hypothetical protein
VENFHDINGFLAALPTRYWSNADIHVHPEFSAATAVDANQAIH